MRRLLAFLLLAGSAFAQTTVINGWGLTQSTVGSVVARQNLSPFNYSGFSLLPGNPLQSPQTPGSSFTVASSNPGTTPTQVPLFVSGALNPAITFLGGNYIQFGATANVLSRPVQVQSYSTGVFGYQFYSDAPAITFVHTNNVGSPIKIWVDGVEQLFRPTSVTYGTAQAGSTSSITLASGASAVNNEYTSWWIHITAGTGAGQFAQITGYVGSTKVASAAFSPAPDATSFYEVLEQPAAFSDGTHSGYGTYYYTFNPGVRRFRHYKVVASGEYIQPFYVSSAIDSVMPDSIPATQRVVWCGDSYSAGTGADANFDSLAFVAATQLGWDLRQASIGGTGYVADAGVSTYQERLVPPVNAWIATYYLNGTTGSFTVTQNGHTVTVHGSDSSSTVQASFDSAFGSGAFKTNWTNPNNQIHYLWMVARGSNAVVTSPMTADFSGLSGAVNTSIAQYTGEIAPAVPYDGNGSPLPFNVVIQGSRNDDGYSDATITSAVASLVSAIKSNFPTATIWIVGPNYLPGGNSVAQAGHTNTAVLAGVTQAGLSLVNGRLPFIDTITPGILTGTGSLGNLKADGNADVLTWTDGVHPTVAGHLFYGNWIAQQIRQILGLY